jgi:hypothetical protein
MSNNENIQKLSEYAKDLRKTLKTYSKNELVRLAADAIVNLHVINAELQLIKNQVNQASNENTEIKTENKKIETKETENNDEKSTDNSSATI